MNAGLMDQLVSLQSYSESVDSNTGEKLQSWSEYATAWSRIQQAESGSEVVDADRREHKQTVQFTIRYNSSVQVKHRIVWDSKNYNIINVANIERDMYLKIQAELVQ
jgi:SPP1 family predicted phage head-tail adaptor